MLKPATTVISAVVLFVFASYARASGHAPEAHVEHSNPGHAASSEHHSAAHASVDEHKAPEHAANQSVETKKEPGFFAFYWNRFLSKLEEAQHVDEHNEILRKRVAEIEIEKAELAEDLLARIEGERVKRLKIVAEREGGHEASRTIASLKTQDPKLTSRPPKKIFEEAMKAFEKNDFETAAKAFYFLTEEAENGAFRDVQTFYLTGVSLFKVGSYKKAVESFQKVVEHASEESVSYAPRAMGWMAVCYSKLGNHGAQKKVARELMQKFPKSKEALRLNRDV